MIFMLNDFRFETLYMITLQLEKEGEEDKDGEIEENKAANISGPESPIPLTRKQGIAANVHPEDIDQVEELDSDGELRLSTSSVSLNSVLFTRSTTSTTPVLKSI